MSSREAFCLPSPISNSELHCRPFQHTSTLPVRDRHHPCITRPLVLAPVQCDAEKTVILGLLAPDSIHGLQPLATSRGNGHRYLCSLSFLPFFFSFLLHCTACGILVPWSGIKSTLPALVQSLNHWPLGKSNPCFTFYLLKHHRVKRYNHLSSGKTMHTLLLQFGCELKINYCILAADMPFNSTWLSSIARHNRTLLMVER